MHVLIQSLKQLAMGGFVYLVLILGYSQVSEAADCGAFQVIYAAPSSGGLGTYQGQPYNVFRYSSTNANPENCTSFVMTGSEYLNLIKLPIQSINTNMTALQTNNTTLQNNQQTLHNSLQTVSDQTYANKAKIEEIEALLQNIGPDGSIAIRDQDNILHINHQDALTLFYAVMGLFAVAFAWRFARNSLNVSETYTTVE